MQRLNASNSIVSSPPRPNKPKVEHKPVAQFPSSRPGSHDFGEYTSP